MRRVLSGIQPTGEIHIGNYLGAIRNWVKIGEQVGKDGLFCIVDLHAMTIPYDPATLARRSFDAALANMAAGLDPSRVTLFVQSHVREHSELGWILTTQTPLGDLERMTQFKDKSGQHGGQHGPGQQGSGQHSVPAGLLMYPVLQAADILLYKADTVPVGEDQLQHIELTREVARRFNARFGQTFPEPQAKLDPSAARVRGTDDAGKMSKSKGNTIGVLEPFPDVWEKLRVAPTDPARVRRTDPGNPFVCLIYHYHTLFSTPAIVETVERECQSAGIGCVQCKRFLMLGLEDALEPIHAEAERLRARPDEIRDALVEGARHARAIAQATMEQVRERVGLLDAGARPA